VRGNVTTQPSDASRACTVMRLQSIEESFARNLACRGVPPIVVEECLLRVCGLQPRFMEGYGHNRTENE